MRGLRRRLAVIIPAVCALILLPIATNIATGVALPAFLGRNKWLSWVGVVVFGLIAVLAVVREQREPRRSPVTAVLPDDRSRAIHHIREIIRQRLDQSMGELVRAELGLESLRTAVAPPTRTYVGVPGGTWEPDGNSTVLDAFDRFDESLLILGEPGAGKTTMLLQLASALLDRTGGNGPLPVLVELGSWRPDKRTARDSSYDTGEFRAWLLDRVQATYSIGAEIAATWLDHRDLVLLLDGLDEVAAGLRAQCVRLINGLQERHPRLRIVVTSRSEQYGRLPGHIPLALRGAIAIRPLTETQLTSYLSSPAFASLRRAVQADPTLRELLTAPIWLNVMAIAFRQAEPNLTGDLAERRRQLFGHYVARMLSRRDGTGPGHNPTTIIGWLSQVATSLHRRNQAVLGSDVNMFGVGQTWRNSMPSEHSAYLGSRVIPVIAVLISLPLMWLFGQHLGPAGSLIGLALSALAVAANGYTVTAARRLPAAVRWRCWRWIPLALLVTSTGIILAEAAARLAGEASSGTRTVTVVVLLLGAWTRVSAGSFVNRREVWDELSALGTLDALIGGFFLIATALVIWWVAPVTAGLFRVFLDGILLQGVWILIIVPLSRALWQREEQATGDVGSSKRTIQMLLAVGGVCVIAAWPAGLAPGVFSLKGVLLLATSSYTALSFFYLADRPWRDRETRLGLAMLGLLPWRMGAFLDEAVDLGLMQRDPDGYRFPHLLIAEYFAMQDPLTAMR